LEALALVLRVRTSYYCRGLRAPLHISGTGQDHPSLWHSNLFHFGIALWCCVDRSTARDHHSLEIITTHSGAQLTATLQCCAIRGHPQEPQYTGTSLLLPTTLCIALCEHSHYQALRDVVLNDHSASLGGHASPSTGPLVYRFDGIGNHQESSQPPRARCNRSLFLAAGSMLRHRRWTNPVPFQQSWVCPSLDLYGSSSWY
jgi:hypothetical protein